VSQCRQPEQKSERRERGAKLEQARTSSQRSDLGFSNGGWRYRSRVKAEVALWTRSDTFASREAGVSTVSGGVADNDGARGGFAPSDEEAEIERLIAVAEDVEREHAQLSLSVSDDDGGAL
jgi:hypothetical protein